MVRRIIPRVLLLCLSLPTQGLTFEQQKEILLLQMAHEKVKHELEIKKWIEVERICQQSEKAKLDLEVYCLPMVRHGILSGEDQGRIGA